jgi:hypothetical protein
MRFNAKTRRFKDAKRNRPTKLSFRLAERVPVCNYWFSLAPLHLCAFALKKLRHGFKRQTFSGGAR